MLLEAGADFRTDKTALLLCACEGNNSVEIIRTLIGLGADVNAVGRNKSPLLEAEVNVDNEGYRPS